MTRVLGAILAGGRSSRFGSDKGAALLDGRTLIAHAADTVARMGEPAVVIGPGGLADRPRPGLGPLGGIAAALAYAEQGGFDSVLTIGCDMPIVPDALLAALLRRAPSFCMDAPILGHWPTGLAEQLVARLESDGDRSVRGWARSVSAVPVASPVPLANVNTRADLERLTPALTP